MDYLRLLDEIHDLGIEVIEKNLPGKLRGMYCDNTILINEQLTQQEKKCILAEELGHHFTSYGNIISKFDVRAIKQEIVARRWSHHALIPLDSILDVKCYCENIHQLAEELDVTEEFLKEAIDHYRQKYGTAI